MNKGDEQLIELLDKRESAIINGVLSKLPNVDAQTALTSWIALSEARKLRNSIIKRDDLEKVRHSTAT